MPDQTSFDPRFDPAFQRGFDGPVTAAPPVASPARVSAPPPARVSAPPTAERPERPVVPVVERAEVFEEPPARTTNPFLITLGVLAVVLIALGLYLFQSTRTAFLESQSSSSGDYITMQTVIFAAPLCIALGVATGIGVLFIYAIRFRR
ncbi:MAG: hypothetical protein ABJB03_11270 [Rhodoglobus sp.]